MAAESREPLSAPEGEPLWVSWLKRDKNFEASFYETLALFEKQAIDHALRGAEIATTEMYEARGVVKFIDQLRHYMTMYEKEAQANAHRADTRKSR